MNRTEYYPAEREGERSMELGTLEQSVKRAFRTNHTDPLVTVAADPELSPELVKAASSLGSKEPSEAQRNTRRGSAEAWV